MAGWISKRSRPVVRGELPLAINANRASDLLAAMRLADEFHLKLILLGAAEGWRVADRACGAARCRSWSSR